MSKKTRIAPAPGMEVTRTDDLSLSISMIFR